MRQLAGIKGNIVHYMGGEHRAKDGILVHWCTERSNTKRGSEGPGLDLSAGAHTVFWLEREDLGTSLLLCPGKMFRQGN